MRRYKTTINNGFRVKTGIFGLDTLLDGGIPKGNIVLISGAAGTGKTLTALEYIYRGAKNFNENGLYLSLEEAPERLVHTAIKFGFIDIDELIKKRKINIIRSELYDLDALTNKIEDYVDNISAKRVVIDSISILSAFTDNQLLVRRTILDISNMLRDHECTTIFTGSVKSNNGSGLGVSPEEYVVDGVISLFHNLNENAFYRSIGIIKMRETAHSEKLHPLQIEHGGIKILSSPSRFLSKIERDLADNIKTKADILPLKYV